MTANLSLRTTLQSEWESVIRMREHVRHLVISTFALDPNTSPVFDDNLYNLPWLLAFDVLKQALLQATVDGQLTGSEPILDDLVEGTRTSLSWNDWQGLREAVKRHNELAHQGKRFGDVQCLQDIADIEAQLVAWGVIKAAKPSVVQ